MSLSRTMLDLVEQVRREERARLAACVRAWGERLGDHIPDGTMFAELAAMIERADGDVALPAEKPVALDEEPSLVEDEIARMFNAAQTVTTVRGRLGEHVVALPFVLDLDE